MAPPACKPGEMIATREAYGAALVKTNDTGTLEELIPKPPAPPDDDGAAVDGNTGDSAEVA